MEIKIDSYDTERELRAVRTFIDYLIEHSDPVMESSQTELPLEVEPVTQVSAPVVVGVDPAAPGPDTTVVSIVETAVIPPVPSTAPVAETEAPVATTAPPATTSADVDAFGVKWDARIHSGKNAATSVKNVKGGWKRRRGIEDAFYDQVIAEITSGAPVVPATPTAATTTTVPPVPTTAPPSEGEVTWPEFLQKIMTATASQQITQDQADREAQAHGATSVMGLNANPEAWGTVLMNLGL